MNAVIDEDLPRSFGLFLKESGFHIFDIRDHQLRGASDDRIFLFAQAKKAVLFSADLGFSNINRYPFDTHHGICILRFPNEMKTETINRIVLGFLLKVKSEDYSGNLLIITPAKLRIRRNKHQN